MDDTSGSPIAPSMIPNTVIATCTVLMKRTGWSMSRNAVRAGRLPFSARSSRRARRAVMSEYSAATKIAFPSTSSRHDDDAHGVAHGLSRSKDGRPGGGAPVLGGSSSSTQAEV